MIRGEGATRQRNLVEFGLELPLLGAQEADKLREQSRVAPVRDHHLNLAVLVAAQARDDAELQQQLLDVGGEPFALRGVADLDRLPRQERRGAIALEQSPQE